VSEDFDPPKEFDDYVILRELGRGQMGRVYLAEDAVLARPVAIKFIASVDPDLTARQSFLMEARAAARIQHPNVVSVYRVGELDDRPYIVSELIRGKSLRESFPLPAGDVLGIAIDLARGLAAAHRRGVVHSDIKPSNAMVTEDGVAKLVDFGLAHVIQEGAEDAGVIAVGTPDYMAPEVLKGRAASRRSDIYSFGAMVCEMVTGLPPGDTPDLAKLDPQLARVVARCLESDPELRFASGEELREALERLQQSRAFAIRVDENPYRGLRAFNADHRGLFFGRGLEVGGALERLRTESMLIVTGDSGVGKSSLIRAGVIPAILDGALGGARTWEAITFVPGRRPLVALAAALGDPTIAARVLEDAEALPRELYRRANDRGIVLFVDQMEELVTVGDPAEVAALEAGLARLSEGSSHVRLIATVRADFLSKIANLPRLGPELARLLFFVSPLPSERLRDVITGPAGVTGFTFESEDMIGKLVDATANAGGGGLPLLSFALAELWEARDRDQRVIKASALDLMGGVAGALARHGDATIASMPALERAAARRVLLRLVTSLGTRVRRSSDELAVGARSALDELVRGRLVVVHDGEDGASYELAHEVLVRGWPTLRDWLEADAEASACRERVAASAAEWLRAGRGRDQLWIGPRLVEATSLEDSQLTALEKEFILASLGGMRRRIWMLRAAALSVVVFIAAGVAIQRYVASHRLADTVAEEVTAARIVLEEAHVSDQLQRSLATSAYARFDRGQSGEDLWTKVLAARSSAETAYRLASSNVEAALAKDPTRGDVRATLGGILYDRAVLAEAVHDLDGRDEMISRMAAYDPEGRLRTRWTHGGVLEVDAPGDVVVEPLDLHIHGPTTLDPGSYIVRVGDVREPVVIERDGHVALKIDLPKIPAGFVYVPAGSFLFGSSADEDTRISFFQTVPIHSRTIGAYFIARTETTIGDWIGYVEAQPGAVMPSQPAKMTGALAITPDRGHYKIAMQPMQRVYTAGWDEPLVYPGRASHAAQDWRKFPVTGVSATEGEAYAAWLDRTGRVRGARMCTELEWERAARGADGRSYPGGDRAGDANVDVTYGRDLLGPDEVGSHPGSISPFGVEDMSGNAFEWTRGEHPGEYVARGGSYYHDRKTANVTNRYVLDKSVHDATLGIRICTALPEQQ
jgi:eukaryotic-like serine/threonine-protein kinase